MDTQSDPEAASQVLKSIAEDTAGPQRPTSSWAIPLITAMTLAAVFCAYYFVYVGSRREYLANRNFRALALLGEQFQQRISVHGNILEFCASLAAGAKTGRTHVLKEDLAHFVLVHPEDASMVKRGQLPVEDEEREALKDYLKYLAPTFDLTEVPRGSSNPRSKLRVERHNDRWELILTAFPHAGTDRNYQGSLKIDELMEPLVGSLPFDDILLASREGTIVYHSKQTGPQFTTLSGLLKAQIGGAETKPEVKSAGETEGQEAPANGRVENGTLSISPSKPQAEKQNASMNQNEDPMWRAQPLHLTDVVLAGTRYKLFLQPVLVSAFRPGATQAEPASEWVVCGLTSSAALEWEALSFSYTFFIWFTVAFFVIWTSYKVLKIFFMNQRERLRLRELGALGLSLVLLTNVITLSLLQLDFQVRDGEDTDVQLQKLGGEISANVHHELQAMSNQLTNWCSSGELQGDLISFGEKNKEIIRNGHSEASPLDGRPIARTPEPEIYPYVNNGFWTDDDGHQIVKWSTTPYVTPMIEVSQLSIWAPADTHLVQPSLTDRPAQAGQRTFHFISILPPNKLEYLGTLGMRTDECAEWLRSGQGPRERGSARRFGSDEHDQRLDLADELKNREDITRGSAFLTAQPLSLIDPILPYGYGFALVDQTGSVLFHSDKTRNGLENFLVESDGSRELQAAIFGHSNPRSMPLTYMGRDYRALLVPLQGTSQAPWSMIVYRDLTSVKTLNLQLMMVTSTLLILVLAGPIGLILIWCAIRRPQFAPEWLWPNSRRMVTYLYQTRLYTLLVILFLPLGFWGSSEEILIACVAAPYAALLLTLWCFRARAWRAGKSRGRKGSVIPAASAAAVALGVIILRSIHPLAPLLLLGCTIVPAVLLLAGPRHYLADKLDRWRAARGVIEEEGGPLERGWLTYRIYYCTSIVLLLLLIGVLIPMALFRASLSVERRLAIKQAQLHLASALAQRCRLIVDEHEKDELSEAAWCAFQEEAGCKTQLTPWSWIVPVGLMTPDGKLPVDQHKVVTRELYSGWFRGLFYSLHHDYNEASAEMLGVIQDRGSPPDWSWENENRESRIVLRWHGAHPASQSDLTANSDLIIATSLPTFSWSDAAAYAGIAVAVMLGIGGLFWALARKVFLLDIAPLKLTGTQQLAESLREGKNVVILLPPESWQWRLDSPKWTIDLAEVARSPKWAEELDLGTIPLNTVIEISHFEFSAKDAEIDNQKFLLLKRLTQRGETQVAVVLTVGVSSEDYRRMFPDFEVIDLREQPLAWLKQYKGPAQDLIWKECAPMAALWPLGAQLAKEIKAENVYSQDTIAAEMLERADPYYRLIWQECSKEQRFVLSQLAEDGLLNPTNGRPIRQLVRRGLITKNPQFRIMNESFRRFLRSATSAQMKQQWVQESRRSGWGRARGAFFTTMTLLCVFLLATQNALWQSAAAYVTAALGALGAMTKLSDTFRGRGSTGRAS